MRWVSLRNPGTHRRLDSFTECFKKSLSTKFPIAKPRSTVSSSFLDQVTAHDEGIHSGTEESADALGRRAANWLATTRETSRHCSLLYSFQDRGERPGWTGCPAREGQTPSAPGTIQRSSRQPPNQWRRLRRCQAGCSEAYRWTGPFQFANRRMQD